MKIEMHTHTEESSPCGHVPASQAVSLYENEGYDLLIITDHYNKWGYEQSGVSNLKEYARYAMNGYHAAKKAASQTTNHICVLPGLEVSLLESPNDYLLYGMTEDFLYAHPDLYTLSLQQLYELCHDNDILLFQAHPNRSYCQPSNPEYLDGAEIYNGNPRHNNNNPKTAQWAKDSHLLSSSGSDFHELEDLAKGGIMTNQDITGWSDLKHALLHHNYSIIEQ